MSDQDERPEIVVQCMWCGRIKDPAEGWKGNEGPLLVGASHGLCPACAWQHYGFRLRGSMDHNPNGPSAAPHRGRTRATRRLAVSTGRGGT